VARAYYIVISITTAALLPHPITDCRLENGSARGGPIISQNKKNAEEQL
jgi:hypothetical protein